jgi:hypothetical protein
MKMQTKLFVNALLGIAVVLGLFATSIGAAVIVGVPDWHQPCLIVAPNGPGPGPGMPPAVGAANYQAWCAPTTAADIMGYWRDVKSFTGLADAVVYNNGVTIPWNPPPPAPGNPNDWQDDSADATVIPVMGGGRTAARNDLGWYLNTNDQGDGNLPVIGPPAFAGTKRLNLQPGLTNYLTAAGYQGSTVTYQAFAGAWLVDWATIQTEIDAGRPMMGLFSHGSMSPGNPLNPDGPWSWNPDTITIDPQTGEDWGSGGTGHAMTIVGYQTWNDPLNNTGNNLILLQDNRKHVILGQLETDNAFRQISIPFCTPGNVGLAPWGGYVAINVVPEPGTWVLLITSAMGVVAWAVRRKNR